MSNDMHEEREVDALSPESTGRWLITTQGSQHIWDLDAMTYWRLPGNASGMFSLAMTGLFVLRGLSGGRLSVAHRFSGSTILSIPRFSSIGGNRLASRRLSVLTRTPSLSLYELLLLRVRQGKVGRGGGAASRCRLVRDSDVFLPHLADVGYGVD